MAILVIGLYISTFLLLDDKSGTQSLFASIIMPVVTILMTIIVLYSKKVEDEEEDHYGLINLFREQDNNGNIFNGIANAFNGVANAVKGLF